MNTPLLELPIQTAKAGFYEGFTKPVALASKFVVAALIFWAVFFPEHAGRILNTFNSFILSNFAAWYILVIASFILICTFLAIIPASGKIRLGAPDDRPEFSAFSWFSMMFGAGIGVGMLTWAIAEPIYHFQNNPEVIQGLATASGENNIRNAYKWSFLHWGIGAWACYALVGMAMAYFSYRRELPLTARSALTPLFGRHLSGPLGHVVDIVAVVATILGAAQALGYGVEQFVAGVYRISNAQWLLAEDGNGSNLALGLGLMLIIGVTIISALSGVGRGIKWLSNISMVLSIILLGFFLTYGASWFGLKALVVGLYDYIVQMPSLLFTVWRPDGTQVTQQLADWQSSWTVFYFAWCVAFAPFVGMFLARISRGRTLREFVFGAMIMPSLMSFVWFTWGGGTAIDLEFRGIAEGAIFAAADGDKIFAIFELLLSPALAWMMAALVVVLVVTFLVTTADSAVLVVNTISAAGQQPRKAGFHIIVWGTGLGVMIATLMFAGGMNAIKTAMVIGALPFSLVMVLMGISVAKAIYRDAQRDKELENEA